MHHHVLGIWKPPGEVTSLEFQDSGYICLCGSCTCESRVTYTLINPWWSDIISQFSDEIKASFYLGPSARFKERPCSRQIRWHASPEIAESTRTSLYISCPSLLECGIVSRSPNALPLMGTLLERVKAKTNAWLDGHDQTNRQLTLSLIKRGRTAERQWMLNRREGPFLPHALSRKLVQGGAKRSRREQMSQARCLCEAEKRRIHRIANVKAGEGCDVTKEVASTGLRSQNARDGELSQRHAGCNGISFDHQIEHLLASTWTISSYEGTREITSLIGVQSIVLKKANDSWMWMVLCRKSRQVVAYTVGDRSRQDVSAVVGGHCRGISPRALLHRRARGLRGGDPQGAAYRRGKRDGRNRPCGAVE